MAGRILRIYPRNLISWSSAGANGQATIWLARSVDVSQWREVSLLVRTHAGSNMGVMATYPTLQVYRDGATGEDPATFFTEPTSLANQVINQQGVSFQVWTLAANNSANSLGGLISLNVKAVQPASPVTCELYLSIDLCGKD